MIKEREELVSNLLSEYLNENKKDGMSGLVGESRDPGSKEINGLSLMGLNRNSDTVKKLESLGFKVIYPASLSEKTINMLDDDKKSQYEFTMKELPRALIIDANEQPTSYLENLISRHYFANANTYGIPQLGGQGDNDVIEPVNHDLEEGAMDKFQDLLNDLGFQTEKNELGAIRITSDNFLPAVKKSKFEQIYDKAKEKIQGVFAKLKSLVSSKDKAKEKDTTDRE